MATATIANLGSEIYGLVDNIPTAISGGRLLTIINRNRIFCEKFLGMSVGTIGSTAIAEEYQGPIVNLSVANLLHFTESDVEVGTKSIKIGEMAITKKFDTGQKKSIPEQFKEEAIEELREIKGRYNFTDVW